MADRVRFCLQLFAAGFVLAVGAAFLLTFAFE